MAGGGTIISMNRRGEYGTRYIVPTPSPIVWMGQEGTQLRRPTAVSVGILGTGLVIGLMAWPSVKKKEPLGIIGIGVSGNMVAVGLTELLFRRP